MEKGMNAGTALSFRLNCLPLRSIPRRFCYPRENQGLLLVALELVVALVLVVSLVLVVGLVLVVALVLVVSLVRVLILEEWYFQKPVLPQAGGLQEKAGCSGRRDRSLRPSREQLETAQQEAVWTKRVF